MKWLCYVVAGLLIAGGLNVLVTTGRDYRIIRMVISDMEAKGKSSKVNSEAQQGDKDNQFYKSVYEMMKGMVNLYPIYSYFRGVIAIAVGLIFIRLVRRFDWSQPATQATHLGNVL